MNRSNLIDALSNEAGITKFQAESIVKMVFDEMSKALSKGDRVELRGLCSFHVRKYKPYTGKSPKTGKPFKVKSKKLPFFKCGAGLKNRVNGIKTENL